MKKRVLAVLFSIVILLQGSVICAFATQPSPQQPMEVDHSVSLGSHSIDAQVPLLGSNKMLESAAAAMLYETNTQTVMYAYNPDVSMHPASLVKIMTALLAIERCDSQETVTVTATAMALIPDTSATIKLQVGESFTMEQMLYALLAGSANDAALVIAEHVSGSVSAFVADMNTRAAEIGCTGTVFTDPHGLQEGVQVTTARDMVRILSHAMQSEDFMKYFASVYYTIPATHLSETRYMASTNYLMTESKDLYYNKLVTGAKTGVTSNRHRSIIATAEYNDLSYIAIILDATPKYESDGSVKYFGSYEEANKLFDIGFDGYQRRQILYDGQVLTQMDVVNGENKLAVGPSATVSTVLPTKIVLSDLTMRYNNTDMLPQAPVATGDSIGEVELWFGSVCVGQSPLVAKHPVRLFQQGNINQDRDADLGGIALIAVICILCLPVVVVILGAAVLLLMRFSNTRFSKRRPEKQRRPKRRRY